MFEYVVRDAAPQDRIDLLAVVITQYGTVERQLAYVGDYALISCFCKVFAEDFELVHYSYI